MFPLCVITSNEDLETLGAKVAVVLAIALAEISLESVNDYLPPMALTELCFLPLPPSSVG